VKFLLIDLIKNIYNEPLKVKIILCKSDYIRTPMFELSEAYKISLTQRFADIDEINFTIPYYIMRNGIQIKNPKFDLIKGDLLLLVEILGNQQYFIIKEAESNGSDIQDKEIKAYSLEYTFSDKLVRGYTGTKKIYDISNPEEGVLNYIISEFPYWSIEYVNPSLLSRFRTFDESERNMWDFIRDLQTTYECVLLFDTVNRTIRADEIQNIGQNKGLIIGQDNYIKNINIKPNYDEVVTRLYPYGKDNLSINSLNPTGTDYIETYEYYKTTDFMSQDLIDALDNYNTLVNSKQSQFQTLLSELEILQDELQNLYTNPTTGLVQLELELSQIRDQIYTAVATNTQPNFDNSVLQNLENDKLIQISNKETQITNKETDITVKLGEITTLKNELAIENNFTENEIKEWSLFWKSKTWRDNNYFDVEELYEDSKDYLLRLAQPALQFNIDSICFLKAVSEQVNWDKLINGLGDLINIEYDKFGLRLEVRLVSFTYDFDGGGLNLEFSNKNSIDDPLIYLFDLQRSSINTSTTIDINKFKYGKYDTERSDILTYINSELDLAKQKAIAGKDEDVTIDERGITLQNKVNTNDVVRLLSNLMVFSDDGMNTVKTAISAKGIIAEHLISKIILSSNLFIEDESGEFNITGNLLTIKDNNSPKKVRVKLGEYANDKYGLQLFNKAGNTVILDEDGILQSWGDSQADNVDAGNKLRIDFYIPDEMISLKQLRLSFRLQPFRAYSTGASSGGGSTSGASSISTTASGGTSTPTTTSDDTVNLWDISGEYSPNDVMQAVDGHAHGIVPHSHEHTHNITIPNHTHGMEHTHSTPNHTHGINYGIFTSTSATGVKVFVDGIERLGGISGYNTDQTNLDLSSWVTTSGWHYIELSSTQLGRISATYFIQTFLGV
jgi:hypothetical protein